MEKDDDVAVHIPGLAAPLYGQFIEQVNKWKVKVKVFKDNRPPKVIEVDAAIVVRWRGPSRYKEK